MIRIPNTDWFQDNKGDLGSIRESFNLDLASNQKKVRLTRSKRLAYTGSPTNFGEVAAMERFDNKLYVASESSGGHDIWEGGNTPYDTLTNDTTSVEINPLNTDLKAWNSGLYLATGNEIYYTTDGSAWSEIGANVLSSTGPHLLESLTDTLYVVDETFKVKSVTSANAFQSSGSQTLNLATDGYTIEMLSAGIDQLWIGLSAKDGGAPSLVFEWDGETANDWQGRYEINAAGIMGGVVKDGTPYVVDSNGRLLAFNGGGFVEVARFPLRGGTFLGFNTAGNNNRAIHPRGMAVDKDEILICVTNRTEGVTSDDFNDFPSGVWAYSETNGLYHKYSASFSAKTDTGTSNMTDHGQFRAYAGGPMMVYESPSTGSDTVASNGGRVVFSMSYFTDADDTSTDVEWGLFTDDTNDTTQKAGWYTSPFIMGEGFRDKWQALYAMLSELETTGDLVELKYRTKEEEPTYFTGTWTGTDRFSTTTELTSYEQGDEITIVQGKGAGAVAHASSLTSGSGSEVILDRAITGVTVGQTSKFRILNFEKIGKVQDISDKGFGIGAQDHRIQVKAYLQWTGKRELYGILIQNTSS